jgi:hypothetical protein
MVAHDPKFSLFHAPSLRRPCWHSSPVEIKRHHYPTDSSFDQIRFGRSPTRRTE